MSIFGPEFEEIWPKADEILTFSEFSKDLLRKCEKLQKPDKNKVDINKLVNKSSNFPIEFGTNTCRVISQPQDRYPIIKQQIGSAYPLIHERVLWLYLHFLEHKCKYGTNIELSIYNKLTLSGFIQRLLSKRCVSFIGRFDRYLLLSGEFGTGAPDGFANVGTDKEQWPLMLGNVLSYDEMKLSALMSVSSHTEFINDGSRNNCGKPEPDKSKIEPAGVVIGLIGSRFQQANQMEWQDIIISKIQNTKKLGYGHYGKSPDSRQSDYRRLWCDFYEEPDVLYTKSAELLKQSQRYKQLSHDCIFDNFIMKKRYTISFDTLLLEAEARAADANKQAYVHVVGIGLGVWCKALHQTEIFLETFWQRLHALLPNLNHVGVVHFSWFRSNEEIALKSEPFIESKSHPLGGIKTFFSNRNPATKLPPEYSDMLPVVSYAWDSNALPGNEFWHKTLHTSSDPAAACSTLITELHNPHINTDIVNGDNLHIASEKYGVIHISDYVSKIIENL